MKCSEIPDEFVLMCIGMLRNHYIVTGRPHNLGVVAWDLYALMRGLTGIETSDNLWQAKMRKMIRKGKVGGCACGCRGDFYDPSVQDFYGMPVSNDLS